MPIATPTDAATANTTLATGNYLQKLTFLQGFPVAPPSNYQGGAHAFSPTIKSPFTTDTRAKKYLSKKKLTNLVDRVAFIKFKPTNAGVSEYGALTFELKYATDLKTTASRTGYVPVWFLPWESGFMWKEKIEPFATVPTINFGDPTIDNVPNPDLFFTAAINGCSVFVNGPADAPKIYHGGIETSELQTIINEIGNANWAAFGGNAEGLWRNLFLGLTAPTVGSAMAINHGSGKNPHEVNKTQYIKDPTQTSTIVTSMKTTPLARALEAHLTTNKSDTVRATGIFPWGCVFGLRNTTNNWEFYLQTNAQVTYYVIRPKKLLGGLFTMGVEHVGKDDKVVSSTENRVMTCKNQSVFLGSQRFFPGGAGHVAVPFNSLNFT
jgi:hypothetical protein